MPAPDLPQWVTPDVLSGCAGPDTRARAWAIVVRAYTPLVAAILRAQGVSSAERLDVEQEVWTRAFRRFTTYQGVDLDAFGAWVGTIARRRAATWAAREGSRRALAASVSAEARSSLESAVSAEVSALDLLIADDVRAAAEGLLSAKQRLYLALLVDEQCTPAEIAELWGISKEHSRNMLLRIRRRLRAALGRS